MRALAIVAETRPPTGEVAGRPLWVVPWALVRDAVVVDDQNRVFLSVTVRPADWAAVLRDALHDTTEG
jgi:hypothetical protein